jgi:NDP-sugar pyrophosphorylase family protein
VSSAINGRLTHDLRRSAARLRGDTDAIIKTIILAGGKGTRLSPHTLVLPKPLLPLGDRAILEFVIRQLAQQGLVDITLSVGHLAHLIEAVFGDGAGHGVDITYVREDVPLGTAGSLGLVEGLDDTFLVLNGDLVTTLVYREIIRSHKASNNVLTIATRRREVKIDYGVIDIDAVGEHRHRVVRYDEKPVLDRMVSMGIYVMEPQVLDFIPENGYFDFPDLVQALLAAEAPIGSFVYDGLWLDIGRHEDYEQAVALWEDGTLGSLLDGHAPQRPRLSGLPGEGGPVAQASEARVARG